MLRANGRFQITKDENGRFCPINYSSTGGLWSFLLIFRCSQREDCLYLVCQEGANFVFSFAISSTIWDVAIFYVFPNRSQREVTFLATSIIFPKGFILDSINVAIYIIVMGLFVILIAWLMRRLRPDFHLSSGAIGRWVCLGVVMSLQEFSELFAKNGFNTLFPLFFVVMYWLAFVKFPPIHDDLNKAQDHYDI